MKRSTALHPNILLIAFTGQFVPQGPADEPASALLEHIRAERGAQTCTKNPRVHNNITED